MIKNIIIFILCLALAWMSKDYFSITLPSYTPQESKKPKNITQVPSVQTKHKTHSQTNTYKPKAHKVNLHTLDILLKQHKFYDALSYYMSHPSNNNAKKIEQYLHTLAQQNPLLALEYMQVYIDEVPESNIKKLLVTTYISQHNYSKAIELIKAYKENYISASEDKRLTAQLKETALLYIDSLVEQKEYAQLIDFLEEMIAYDTSNSFYSFRLAQLYLELDKTEQASVLLDELQYDEVYAQKVKSYIQEISIEETSDTQYDYAIALNKYGEHYVVNVLLDGTPFRLMLDTGATYIYIDKDKASMLKVINNNLHLQTAGGDIDANLCNASVMQVGNLELHDIKVTTAPFKREDIDGLLGMNFLNRFSFYINQEEGILYLNNK